MKWTVTSIVLLCAAIILAEDAKDVPAFVQSLLNLQRGPPEPPSSGRAAVTEHWIEQKLDHFDPKETGVWQMRYLQNNDFFVSGAPIFIYVGGEWTVSPGSISSGHFVDIAREHNGVLFYTEHRFYGESKPKNDLSLDSLKYLDVAQALADLAHFIEYQRASNSALANSKVIMAGGSYAATMVVWFKRLYPELLTGGWASSAPLLAKVDFREYKEVVGRSMLELGSQRCYNRIENGIAELEAMLANNRGAEVKAMLKICNNFDEKNDLDVWSLFGSISNVFAGITQYQKEGQVPTYCNQLMSYDTDVNAIASFILWYYGYPTTCLDFSYSDTLKYYLDITYKGGAGRPWYYQTCNEYGWYQSSASRDQPFGTKFPALLYTTLCGDIFSAHYTNEFINANTDLTNAKFGGMSPNVTHVYMTHGALDPWNPMGNGVAEGATVIPRASHCADFGTVSPLDSPEMLASKLRIAELVREWLAE